MFVTHFGKMDSLDNSRIKDASDRMDALLLEDLLIHKWKKILSVGYRQHTHRIVLKNNDWPFVHDATL